jgi:hypothetical protein
MMRYTCLMSSFDSGGGVSGGRGRCASLPYCLGSEEYGQCWGHCGQLCLYFLQLFEDVSWHGDIKGVFIIIQFEAYAAV